MENILELGTDVKSDWSFDDEGDLILVSNDDNLTQAINNRLNTTNGELDNFYSEYGSFLRNFLGWKKNNETLTFMKLELDTALSQDPRLKNFTSNLKYNDDGDVELDLTIHFTEDTDLSLSFIITDQEILQTSEDEEEE